jgi:hypothetical protein
LSLSSAFTGPAGGPKAFDIAINLSIPFLYTPSSGNLLLDVRNFSGDTATAFDATNTGAIMSRVFSSGANGVGDPTGSPDFAGLVTQFTIVPEPETFGLLADVAIAVWGGALLPHIDERDHRTRISYDHRSLIAAIRHDKVFVDGLSEGVPIDGDPLSVILHRVSA